MIINHNLSAMNAHRQLGANQAAGAKAQEKLSSGLRINRAGDDAAGLAISEKMRAQVRGLDQASTNAQDGISLIQTAEGALSETHSILQRMRELATQASNDTNTESDRNEIQKEVNSLTSEINRIGNTTEFNTQKLLNGDKDASPGVGEVGDDDYVAPGSGESLNFQIGANESQSLSLNIGDMRAVALGISTTGTADAKLGVNDGTNNTVTEQALDVSDHTKAGEAITKIQDAIDKVSAERSQLGANQNRLEHTISNLNNSSENLQAAESRIRDVDMAKEIMEFTKNNILSQASQSMLAQANQAPQQVLQLLG